MPDGGVVGDHSVKSTLKIVEAGTAERVGQGAIASTFGGKRDKKIVQAENGKYLFIYDLAPPLPTFEHTPRA